MRTAGPARAAAVLLLWIGGCAAGMAALWSVDDPRFAAPPLDPRRWGDWAAANETLDLVAGVSRILVTLALGYLAFAALLHLATALAGSRRLRGLSARLNPAPIAGLVTVAAVGFGPAAGATSGPDPAGQKATMVLVDRESASPLDPEPVASIDAPRMTPVDGDGSTAGNPPQMKLVTGATPTVDETPPDSVSVTTTPQAPARTDGTVQRETQAEPVAPAPVPEAPPSHGVVDLRVVVGEGDNLWGIAKSRVALALGDEPPESEVRTYWLALIDANADRLVKAGNPDLIEPGQELLLPG